MNRAPTLKMTMITWRTPPLSPVRFVENVVLITGPRAAPARVPHWPVPTALVMIAPATEPRTASSSAEAEKPGASCRSPRNDRSGCDVCMSGSLWRYRPCRRHQLQRRELELDFHADEGEKVAVVK